MALLFFIENEPPLPEVKPASGFFISNLVKLSQVLVNYSEFPNTCEVIVRSTVQNYPRTVQLFQVLCIKD